MAEQLPVIFRKWETIDVLGDGVIAVFPTIPASVTTWELSESYERIGQHSACNYQRAIMPQCRIASPAEYRNLLKELNGIYGPEYELVPTDEETEEHRQIRKSEWERIILPTETPNE